MQEAMTLSVEDINAHQMLVDAVSMLERLEPCARHEISEVQYLQSHSALGCLGGCELLGNGWSAKEDEP